MANDLKSIELLIHKIIGTPSENRFIGFEIKNAMQLWWLDYLNLILLIQWKIEIVKNKDLVEMGNKTKVSGMFRLSAELLDVKEKVYTRDLYHRD